jgi:hypothetical protein
MTHDRTDTIPLAPSEPRCEPASVCNARGSCARYQAAIPAHGAKIDDYSRKGGGVLCRGYLNSASVRKVTMPVHRRVHPAPEGL